MLAILLLLASTATIVAIGRAGWAYYRLPLAERVRSPLHATWKPGGSVGKRLGLVGTGLMLANLAYMARRRARVLSGLGTTRAWLEMHVFCGLTGPAILVFHSAFLAQNLVARVTVASTALVVAAGVVGRYLYGRLPRDIEGKELALADLVLERRALAAELREALPPEEEALAAALAGDDEQAWSGHGAPCGPAKDAAAERASADASAAAAAGLAAAPGLVAASIRADLARALESYRLARRLREAGVPRADAARAAALARRIAGLRLRIAHLGAFRRILALWREVHVKLAAVMIACIVIHVAVVSALGYGKW